MAHCGKPRGERGEHSGALRQARGVEEESTEASIGCGANEVGQAAVTSNSRSFGEAQHWFEGTRHTDRTRGALKDKVLIVKTFRAIRKTSRSTNTRNTARLDSSCNQVGW